MVVEGTEMITKDLPIAIVAVPKSALDNETSETKKSYKFNPNKEETIGDVQGSTQS